MGFYHFSEYGLRQKIKEISLVHVAIFGIIQGIGAAVYVMCVRDVSPHFMMIINCANLPVDFLLMIFFMKYRFNIWKAIVVIIATAAIIVTSVLMKAYFDQHPSEKQVKDQNMVKGILMSLGFLLTSVLNDLQIFKFREKYFSDEHPFLDIILLYTLMLPFSTITLICSCAITGESFSPPRQINVWICIFIYSISYGMSFLPEFYLINMMDPIFLRVGVLLRIPTVFILDWIFRHIFIHFVEIIGAIVVVSSIICYGVISWYELNVQKSKTYTTHIQTS